MGQKHERFWLNYDLGLRGDYPGLYSWLDSLGARETGPSSAIFTLENEAQTDEEVKELVLASLSAHCKLKEGDRVYLIWNSPETGKSKGSYIYGNRLRPKWEGYSKAIGELIDDE